MPTHDIEFTATHHAKLFACISKAVILQVGQGRGEPVIREAVKTYGHQRGKRMALRAQRNGHPLTAETYFAYGEWTVPKGMMDFKLVERRPHARLNIFKCPWYDIWEKENTLNFGRYFCMEIDAALVKGFNPELEFVAGKTRPNGGDCCDFVFKGADLTIGKVLGILYKKKFRPGKEAIMPWAYHTGHLFKVMVDAVAEKLPADSEKILENTFTEFTGYFSGDHLNELKAYQNIDFNMLPR